MNPFALPGPLFLAFYAALGLCLWAGVFFLRRILEPSELSARRLTDPYEIAVLRDGAHAALRIAVVRLMDAGLLRRSGENLEQTVLESHPVFEHRIEEEVWKSFSTAAPAVQVFDLASRCLPVQESLISRGLLPDQASRTARMAARVTALGILAAIAAVRVAQALSHGRHNVIFLLILAALFGAGLFFYRPRRTPAGDRTLEAMKSLYRGLKARAPLLRANESPDLLMTAALFGIALLPPDFAYAREMFPKSERSLSDGGGSSSGCGSGCGAGSSSGSDGGSSGCGGCGGGGCGGGCGG